MNQPLLSVIVPCYNLEDYVDKCVSSIVGQTYDNLEILLIDDGSADETGARCDAWVEKDKRIRVIHKQK
jgi:glycosyltransferase involved in cell wall biosynthesis